MTFAAACAAVEVLAGPAPPGLAAALARGFARATPRVPARVCVQVAALATLWLI